MKTDKDYYQILGIPRGASDEDVKKAYRLYAAKFHPDKHEGDSFFEERFKELSEAYEILSDEEKRARYDLRRFGRTRKRKVREENNHHRPVRKFRFDVSYFDMYLTIFYLVNLSAWVVIRRLNWNGSSSGHIWSLFLCGASTLFIWVFFTGLIDSLNNPGKRKTALFAWLILALFIGAIPLFTHWIP